jgi:hypothetical protein
MSSGRRHGRESRIETEVFLLECSVFNAGGCTVQRVSNIKELELAIIFLHEQDRWDGDFYLAPE